MKQLVARISAPFALFAATLLTVVPAFAANDCNDPRYNLLPGKLTLMKFPPSFCGANGIGDSLLTPVVTLLNALALGIVLLLGFRLVMIGFGALAALNKKDAATGEVKGEMQIVQQTALSIVQALLVAVAGYLIVANAPVVLIAWGNSLFLNYEKDPACLGAASSTAQCFTWLDYTGPFYKLAAAAQSWLALIIVVIGTFLLGKNWLGYLQKTSFTADVYKNESDGMKLEILQNALKRTVAVMLVTLIAYFAVTGGPDLFARTLFDIGSAVTTDPGGCIDPNNC